MRQYKGKVSEGGTWLVEAAAGWTIEHTDVGAYTVNHYQANLNYSLSLDISTLPGTIKAVHMGASDFSVQVSKSDGSPMDCEFNFTVTFN